MRNVFKNLSTSAIGIGFSLILGELVLRLMGISYPSFYTVDFHRGYGLRPRAQGISAREGKGLMRVNSDGFRGAEVEVSPQPGRLRVAFLGDSFTEAQQVNEEETFIGKIQITLSTRSCPLLRRYPQGVEFLNFGVGGYGTGQQLLTWRHLAKRYRPELVVLVIYPGNDFTDNEPRTRADRPVFKLDDHGNLVIDNAFRSGSQYQWRASLPARLIDSLINHSRLVQLLNEAKNRQANAPSLASAPENTRSIPLNPKASERAWRITELLVYALEREVRASGARLVVISTSSPDQVWPDRSKRPTDPFSQERRLSALLKDHGIPYLALGPELQKQADSDQLVLHGFVGQAPGEGHWNQAGHNLAAEIIRPWLCRQ